MTKQQKMMIKKLVILLASIFISYCLMCFVFNILPEIKKAMPSSSASISDILNSKNEDSNTEESKAEDKKESSLDIKAKYFYTVPEAFQKDKKMIYIISIGLGMFFAITITKRMAVYDDNDDIDGSERWMTLNEVKKAFYEINENRMALAEKSGIILSYNKGTFYVDTDTTNSLIIGTTRSGKGQTYVLPTARIIIESQMKQSLIFNDPKGEILENLYDLLIKNGYGIKVLNLCDTNRSDLWNPLSIIISEYKRAMGSDKDISKVNKLIGGLASTFTDNHKSDPIWPQSAKSLLTAMILLLLEKGYANDCLDKLNMYSVYNFFLEYGSKNEVKSVNGAKVMVNALDEQFKNLPLGNPAKLAYATSNFSSGDTRSSIFTTLASNLEIFGSDTGISKLTSGNDIDFTELINPDKPLAIFMVVADEETSRHVIASLFVNQCYSQLIEIARNYPGQILPQRIHFILDEFGNMTRIPSMDTKMTICLGRNILFDLYLQDLNQLDSKYRNKAKTIRGNYNNLIYINSLDGDTNEYISRILDSGTVQYNTYSGNLNDWLNHQNLNYKGRRLMTPGELRRMKKGEVVIIKQREYPIKTKLKPFFKYKLPKINFNDIPIPENRRNLSDWLFPFDEAIDNKKKTTEVQIKTDSKSSSAKTTEPPKTTDNAFNDAFNQVNTLTNGEFEEMLDNGYLTDCFKMIAHLKFKRLINADTYSVIDKFLNENVTAHE